MDEPVRYRKKPVEIEAIQYLPHENCREVGKFMGFDGDDMCDETENVEYAIETLEGVMMAQPGDWIIRGVKGEFYPCKPDIFEQTYEKVLDDAIPSEAGWDVT